MSPLFRSLLRSTFHFGILAVIFLSGSHFHPPPAAASHLKFPAPDFKLKDPSGKEVSLSDFRGKTLVLVFWSSTCPVCIEHVPRFNGLYEYFKNKGVVILGIVAHKGLFRDVKELVKKYKVTYPTLQATPQVLQAYRVHFVPLIYLINPQGFITHIYLGADAPEIIKMHLSNLNGR